ncbi:uncharacterized protein LOC135638684 [Musa acuminata AAA Group]|uniref:uncharacterized protein LOC135638684 n=1 Tax=Musa acuminata AAA Group TaxID=214697 RepID=UPI0031D7EFDA
MQMPLEPPEPPIEVPLKRSQPDLTVKVGAMLPEADRLHLIDFLRKNADVFAWSPKEMPRIDPEVVQHRLNINPEEQPDKEDTAFVTNRGAYYYKVMPFGLKNAGATYQWMVDKLFKHQLGRNMEVYVDDMIVTSKITGTHLADLAKMFNMLRRFNMRLNPTKCIFGVSSRRFLSFIIHQRGIDTNLKKSDSFTWIPKCKEAFEKLKACLTRLPQLASPELGETLGLYLVASAQAISSVLVQEVPPAQQPVHYVSHTLGRLEAWYSLIEKLALALIKMARKLQSYFQAHTIRVIIDQPLIAIKAQALADFIFELTPEDHAVGWENNQNMWTLHIDGSSTSGAVRVGLILKGSSEETYERSLQLQFRATNNEAEYEALLHGLHLALEMHVDGLEVFSDSQLVTGHVNGSYEARDPTMVSYLMEAKRLAHRFNRLSITRIAQAQNVRADALARSASTHSPGSAPTTESIATPTVTTHEVAETNSPPSWMEEILRYKVGGEEPDDLVAAR